jgi:hypothetical protein
MEERAALFPMVIGIPCLALALLAFGQELFGTLRRDADKTTGEQIKPPVETTILRSRAFAIVAWILGFFLAIWLLGFPIAVPVASFLYFRLAGGEKWSVSLPLSAMAGVVFYGLFDYLLHLPFPEGVLLAWLNLVG